jgi:copper transport protein
MLEQLTAILKGLTYFSALSGAGIVLSQATLLRGRPADAGRKLLIRIAGAVLASAAFAATMVFAVRLDDASTTYAIEAVLFSPLGAALGLQIMGGIWIAMFASRPIALAGGILILCSFGVVGHSATRGFVPAATVLVHVSTAAWWLGGLWTLLIASSKENREAFEDLVKKFSRQAIWIVALLLVAAVATAAQLLGFQINWTRDYDFGLVVKAGLTLGLLALAAANRYALSTRLETSPFVFKLLRCAMVMEIALFIAIIMATAWLTTWHSPHERDQEEAQISGPITIIEPWAPASVGTLPTGAGYLMIVNSSQTDDRLLSASSP